MLEDLIIQHQAPLRRRSRQALGPTSPLNRCVTGPLPSRMQMPGRETNHLPSSEAEVKNAWS